MPSNNDTLQPMRAAIARASRRRGYDPTEVDRLRREYAELKLAEMIRTAVAKSPPLSPEQADRLAALLRSGK